MDLDLFSEITENTKMTTSGMKYLTLVVSKISQWKVDVTEQNYTAILD